MVGKKRGNTMPNDMALKDREEYKLFGLAVQDMLRALKETPLKPLAGSRAPIVFANDKEKLEELQKILDGNDEGKLKKIISSMIPLLKEIDLLLEDESIEDNDRKFLQDYLNAALTRQVRRLDSDRARILNVKKGIEDPVLNLIRGIIDDPLNDRVTAETLAKTLGKNKKFIALRKILGSFAKISDYSKGEDPIVILTKGLLTPATMSDLYGLNNRKAATNMWQKSRKWLSEHVGFLRGTKILSYEKNEFEKSIIKLNEKFLGNMQEEIQKRIKDASAIGIDPDKRQSTIEKIISDTESERKSFQIEDQGLWYATQANVIKFRNAFKKWQTNRLYNASDFLIVKHVTLSIRESAEMGKRITGLRLIGATVSGTVKFVGDILSNWIEQSIVLATNVVLFLPSVIYSSICKLRGVKGDLNFLKVSSVSANIAKSFYFTIGRLLSDIFRPLALYVNLPIFIFQGKQKLLTQQILATHRDLPKTNMERERANLESRKYLHKISAAAIQDPVLKFYMDAYDKNNFANGSIINSRRAFTPKIIDAMYSYILSVQSSMEGNKHIDYVRAPAFIGDIKSLISQLEEQLSVKNLTATQKQEIIKLATVINAQLKIAGADASFIDVSAIDSKKSRKFIAATGDAAQLPAPAFDTSLTKSLKITVVTSFSDLAHNITDLRGRKSDVNSPVIRIPEYIESCLQIGKQPIKNYFMVKVTNRWITAMPRIGMHDYQIFDDKKNLVGKITFSRPENNFTLHLTDGEKAIDLIKSYVKFLDTTPFVDGPINLKISNVIDSKLKDLKDYVFDEDMQRVRFDTPDITREIGNSTPTKNNKF